MSRAHSVAAVPWWRTLFDDAWLRLHEPLFPPEQSRREVAGMIGLLGLPLGARVLDVPCGWGRHTRLLREAGLRAVGADLSRDMLRAARGAGPRRQAIPCAAADVRTLPFRDASFDAVINVCTGFGLFGRDQDDVRALREQRRVLAPGGALLIETMHRDEIVRGYAERDAWQLPDGTRVAARRRFDPLTGMSHEVWRWRRGSESGEKRHTLLLRTAGDVARLVQRAGFRRLRAFGGWEGDAFTHRSPHLILLAVAPPARLREGPAAR